MQTAGLLTALAVAGLMGMVGQGARTVVGLKKLYDANAMQLPGQQDAFMASRLVISLMIGLIAGVLAAIALGIENLAGEGGVTVQTLLGLAAAGYAGADFVEGFIAKTPLPGAPAAQGVPGAVPPNPAAKTTVPDTLAEQQGSLADRLDEHSSAIRMEFASLKAAVAEALPEGVERRLSAGFQLNPDLVAQLFPPSTPRSNIRTHLPNVLAGLRACSLTDRTMLLMALATIRAESEGFVPIDEFVSRYNTETVAFDRYEPGTAIGARLGNTEPGDGARFKGRGFIQLTGRDNYTRIGRKIGADLIGNPALANDSETAGRILAQFLANHEDSIRSALYDGDLRTARKLVNGGSHGFDRFKDAYEKGLKLIPDGLAI